MGVKANGQNLKMQHRIQEESSSPRLVDGVDIDLLRDLGELCEQYLKEKGVEREGGSDPIADFVQFVERFIEVHPRQVFKAKNFSCPSEYENKLKYFEYCIEEGKDLNPFLSRNVKNLRRNDLMQLDWNIRHFHISDQRDVDKNDGFMKRSDCLLMAYVTEYAVYFITVEPHGKEGAELWADAGYVQIIKDNWPWLLESYRFNCKPSLIHISKEERYASRKKHVNLLTELPDGCGYVNIGGGCLLNGTSINSRLQFDLLIRQIPDLEKLIANYFLDMLKKNQEICPQVRAISTPSLKLLEIDCTGFTLEEPQLNVLVAASLYGSKWIISTAPRSVINGWTALLLAPGVCCAFIPPATN